MSRTVLLIAGGTTPSPHVQAALPPAAMCIAADSGLDHARAMGLVPDLAVGDFDSVSPEGLDWARSSGVALHNHPADKDKTDLELAIDEALAAGGERIVAVGIGGGRFDHLLANMALLADRRYASAAVDALVGTARVAVVHDERYLDGSPDELISLLPVHGDAIGVTTVGLGYELREATMSAGTSWGVSNYFINDTATVSVAGGTLLAVQPDRLDSETRAQAEPAKPGGR